MMEQIESLIEEEVKRRLEMTLQPFIAYIGTAYDISPTQLYKDYMTVMHIQQSHMCKGMTLKKKPCSRTAHAHGYCKIHQSQYKPSAPVRIIPGAGAVHACTQSHKPNKIVRDVASCFINE